MGFGEKLKGIFGGKKDVSFESEEPVRREPMPIEIKQTEDDAGTRWMQAKRMREEREMNKPLIQRKRF